MLQRPEAEAFFLQNLGWIERVCASLCRRGGVADEAEDFASWARMRLMEDDYAIVRKFRGESAVTTYLTVALSLLFHEYRARERGRWRPSAAARREGPVAVRLERLVGRDGLRLEEAARVMRSAGETDLSDRQLAELLARLPARSPPRPVALGPEALAEAPAPGGAEVPAAREAAEAERARAEAAVARALDGLEPEDRAIVRLRFWEGLSVADVARGLGLPQKPLYRRIERALARLRTELEAAGVDRARVRELLADDGG